jgi:predicted transcriptional regulator
MSQFTPGELEVMHILWEHGEQKPGEIQAKFPRDIKNSALRSFLSILLDKGHITRRQKGKAFFYKAKTKQTSAFRSKLRELVDVFCDGSTESLLMNLIRSEKLSDNELLELKRLAEGGIEQPPQSGAGS